jgi:hypothetical protein
MARVMCVDGRWRCFRKLDHLEFRRAAESIVINDWPRAGELETQSGWSRMPVYV